MIFFVDSEPHESPTGCRQSGNRAMQRDGGDSSLKIVTVNIANKLYLDTLCNGNDILCLQEH